MSDPHKVTIKIGDAEFSAEGDKETVAKQFEAFLAALAIAPRASAPAKPAEDLATDAGNNGSETTDAIDNDADSAMLKKAFQVAKQVVSLKYLPRTSQKEADALLLLLYGYAALKGEEQVLGTQLINAARISGVNLDRIDRTIAKHDSLLLRGGARKGMKYGLNNQGKLKAKEMLTALFAA
ncbi:MAG TPA: hypothetical protein VEX35_01495 [Allosphingosinicella sp.]|nr:hypothetical protein [Allosphingosinicella sp.]